jgi:hypothetical protein
MMRSRAELLTRCIDAFAFRAEVRSVHEFGRAVDGKIDEYSDLDLVVCSDDLARTQRDCLPLLGRIAPVLGVCYIRCEPTDLALMVMLEGFSPYQKIDLGVVADLETKREFGPFRCLHDSGRADTGRATTMAFEGEQESLANRLNDLLFSIPRFTKCLFRNDWDMYRRWVGMTESLAVLLHDSYFGWRRKPHFRLTPPEYKALYAALSSAHRQALNEIQPLDGQPNLAEGFVRAVDWVIELFAAMANALAEPLDLEFARYLQAFLAAEAERAIAMPGVPGGRAP